MMSLGWGDPIESQITLVYRRQGEKREHGFHGAVAVLGEDRKKLTWLKREELPLHEGRLDLSRVPVVGIGGKRKHQPGRAQSFLESNPDFQGALLLYPGTGNWDLGEGMLFVTSREILSGKRVSGGKPEVQLTNHRWLRDGRYVADRAKMLHGKVLETIEAELEEEPGAEAIVKAVTGWTIPHRLRDVINEVSRELHELEGRRVMLTGEQARNMSALVHERLVEKFREAGVRYVRDIPENLTVTAEEIAPELVSERDALGTVEVPGLGRRLPKKQYARFGFGDQVPTVELSIGEFRQLESWPFAKVYPVLTELGDTRDQLDYGLRDAIEAPEAERIGKCREFFARRWLDRQRSSNRPKDEKVADPLETDPPATPEPVIWGFDLMTGEEFKVYAALVHSVHGVKGRIVDSGWTIRWYDEAGEAAKVDAEARREAESFITARKLEAELTAEAKVGALPVELPAAFVPFTPTLAQVMELLGFTAEQFRIEGEGPVSVCVSPESGYHSEVRDRYVVLERARYADRWWRKDGEVIVVFANATVRHLIGDGDYDWGAAGQLEMAKEKIQAVRDWLAAERQKAEDSYRAQVREFVQNLQSQPAHASMSSDGQAKLAGLADSYGLPDPSRIADELRTEWAKAEALQRRVESGAILTNFGGHFRVMGATGNAQYWVIMPDGSERDADEVSYRKRYTSEGEKKWRLVGPEELAISWFKAYTAADHEFVVNKLPEGGCTEGQLATIGRIEREISERFYGSTGMSGTSSPEIGKGWGLRKQSKPESTPQPTGSEEKVDLSQVDLSKLFNGGANFRR